MRSLFPRIFATGLLLPALSPSLIAEVTLPKVLGDHMVLQRSQPVPVWGEAAPGETVTVKFQQQEKHATADAGGKWSVTLDALKASNHPATLTISGTNQIVLRDILVGEVWLCSGQSNMESPAGKDHKNLKAAATADPVLAEDLQGKGFPEIRLFRVEKKLQPPDVVSEGWKIATPDAIAPYSAVGYTFARKLQRELGVPVGMIQSAWGGTRIEVWTPAEAYQNHPAFHQATQASPLKIDGLIPGSHYTAMVLPLAPFSIKGAVWYQGESNVVDLNDAPTYADKFEAMVQSWRAAWHQPSLPVFSVQIAPYLYSIREKDPVTHTTASLPEFWETQFLTTRIPHTGIVPSMDIVDNYKDIHPLRKRPIGERLASLALADVYQRKNLTTSGPVFQSATFNENTATLTFKHVGKGLQAVDGKPLTHFEIAGADGVFQPAEARVTSPDTIVATSETVTQPSTVRYAWHEAANPNLTNDAGWPAFPFRSNPASWHPKLSRTRK
ncbi:MAG: sialate O-acetylesterase [Luteolibacter sp.]